MTATLPMPPAPKRVVALRLPAQLRFPASTQDAVFTEHRQDQAMMFARLEELGVAASEIAALNSLPWTSAADRIAVERQRAGLPVHQRHVIMQVLKACHDEHGRVLPLALENALRSLDASAAEVAKFRALPGDELRADFLALRLEAFNLPATYEQVLEVRIKGRYPTGRSTAATPPVRTPRLPAVPLSAIAGSRKLISPPWPPDSLRPDAPPAADHVRALPPSQADPAAAEEETPEQSEGPGMTM